MTESSTTAITLAGGSQPLLLLQAHVNNCGPFDFILDTGASLCLIAPRVASATGVSANAERQATGAAGQVALRTGIAKSISVGGTTVANVPVGVTDELVRIGRAVGARIDGAVGYEYLRKVCVTIDYPARSLTLSTSASDLGIRDAALPLRLASPRKPLVLLDAYLNEDGPFVVALDTGASTTAISYDVAKRLHLRLVSIPQMTGGGGTVEAAAGLLQSLRVDTAVANDIEVVATSVLDVVSNAIERSLDGILGYNFLKDYRVTLDYLEGRLALTRG